MTTPKAVIFDLGGVVYPSPFEAFDVYDGRAALAVGTTRAIVRASSEGGAWAALERGELTMAEFFVALDAEAAAMGHTVETRAIMATVTELSGARPEMITAIHCLRGAGLAVGALTNNWVDDRGNATPAGAGHSDIASLFDSVVESARVGLRKPDPRIYALVCERLGVTPPDCVFLDDLGINLKPARAMGMTTIKVASAAQALSELAAAVGIALHESVGEL